MTKEHALAALIVDSSALRRVSPKLLSDYDFILDAVMINGRALEHVPLAFRIDREIVLAAVSDDGSALKFAPLWLQADHDILSAASSARPKRPTKQVRFAPPDDPVVLYLQRQSRGLQNARRCTSLVALDQEDISILREAGVDVSAHDGVDGDVALPFGFFL